MEIEMTRDMSGMSESDHLSALQHQNTGRQNDLAARVASLEIILQDAMRRLQILEHPNAKQFNGG